MTEVRALCIPLEINDGGGRMYVLPKFILFRNSSFRQRYKVVQRTNSSFENDNSSSSKL